ncbi:MAG: AAA family ATPase [Candidatus Hydrogenedentota bacterium]
MRIRTLWLDGYGRFIGRELSLQPGFQIILGPNEQGKTTVRTFIGDMLYGQKRSATQRLYDEGHELRRPWRNPEVYRGRLLYELDDGREIEAHRNFDRRNESIEVFDRTHQRNITADFEQLRNREKPFAETHLGLGKQIFLHAATISHGTLETLGDEDSLRQIREKLLALADSGEYEGSADAALRLLQQRVMAIGKPTARTKPLPAAKSRLAELDRELEAAEELSAELEELETRQRRERERLEALRQRHAVVEGQLQGIEKAQRARRLREAERLQEEVNAVTKACFSLQQAAAFPLDRMSELDEAAKAVTDAEQQLARSREELARLEEAIETEKERLGPVAEEEPGDISEEWDDYLRQLEEDVQFLRKQVENGEEELREIERLREEAERSLQNLPDFSRIRSNPMEWVGQLVNTFERAVSTRDSEAQERDRLEDQVAEKRAAIEEPQGFFERHPEIGSHIHEYEEQHRETAEELEEVSEQLEEVSATLAEEETSTTRDYWLAGMSVIVMTGCAYGWYVVDNPGLLVPIALTALLFLWTLGNMFYTQRRLQRLRRELDALREQKETAEHAQASREAAMQTVLQEAGCQSLRELEAYYERYLQAAAELERLEAAAEEKRQSAEEEEQQVARLFNKVKQTFEALGESLREEDQIRKAGDRVIQRYQAYREANNEVAKRREEAEAKRQALEERKAEWEQKRLALRDASLEVRDHLRKHGFPEEHYDSASRALRAFRKYTAEWRQKRNRLELQQQHKKELEDRIAAETEAVETARRNVERLAEELGGESYEDCQRSAEHAREYEAARQRRQDLNRQLEQVLNGDTLQNLRERVRTDGEVNEEPAGDADALRRERDELDATIDASLEALHEMQIELARRRAGARPINEIEEERAHVQRRVDELTFEMDATAHASEAIDAIARDRHARIAPHLARRASTLLSTITAGAYNELFIDRDLNISVRMPQTSHINAGALNQLSKGTVDQIYFALRLALIETLSKSGERIPMLLDDPFGNYDDRRLAQAMQLLARLGQQSQIILFTCREDVVEAGKQVNAPILTL